MTGDEFRAIRHKTQQSEWEFYKLLYGPGEDRDKGKLKIRQFERGVRPIPPMAARCASLTLWHFEQTGAIPAWEDT